MAWLKQDKLIIFFLLVKFFIPFVMTDPLWELHRDEFLYYQQGQHLAWGYLENPPMIGWLATISGLFGGGVFWIKFWPAIFGTATMFVSFAIARIFGGGKFSLFIVFLGLTATAFLRGHFLFQPNFLEFFFWTLAIYFLARFLKTGDSKYIYFLSLTLSLSFLSKYSAVFLIAAIVIALLVSDRRKIFLSKHFYYATSLSLLIVAPNIYWQWAHNWPLVHHMRELQQTQLQLINPKNFLVDQLIILLPVTFVWVTGLIWTLSHRQYRAIGLVYLVVIILLFFGRGKSYYAAGLYPALIAIGAHVLEKFSKQKLWLRVGFITIILVPALFLLPMALPVWNPAGMQKYFQNTGMGKTVFLTWEDQRVHSLPQDYADMLGWKELTEKTEKFFNSLPDSMKNSSVIYCRNYGQAGSLKFYALEKNFANKVISDNGSFLLWIPRNLKFNHLVFIGRRMPNRDDEVFQHFEKVSLIDSVTNIFSRQLGDRIIFFQNIDSSGLRIANEGLDQMKKEFQR